MLENFTILGNNMIIKVHFPYSYLDQFPENPGDVSHKVGKRFHQDIKTMGERYQERWDIKWWQLTARILNVTYSIRNIQENLRNANFYRVKYTIIEHSGAKYFQARVVCERNTRAYGEQWIWFSNSTSSNYLKAVNTFPTSRQNFFC